jgi:hypothetical protein
MTISDAGGVARFTPGFITRSKTLEAITKDVYEVLDAIRQQRQKLMDR